MRFIVFLCAAFLCAAPAKGQELESFVSRYEDLPLMEGLVEDVEQGTLFDSPEGRFIDAYAQSDTLSVGQVLAFYDEALPQLGWEKTGDDPRVYEREGETLTLEFLQPSAPLVVKFEIK